MRRMSMKIAVYKVPPSPNNENGANADNDFMEHNGVKTMAESSKITLARELTIAGRLNVCDGSVNVMNCNDFERRRTRNLPEPGM